MILSETLALKVGTSVVKTAVKRWLKDEDFVQDATLTVAEMLSSKFGDVMTARKGDRSFQSMADEIGERLTKFYEVEAGGIEENEKIAAALAVSEDIENTIFDTTLLFQNDLNPRVLERLVIETSKKENRFFEELTRNFYKKLLSECCTYIVETTSTLPNFQLKASQEILRRDGEILRLIREVLDELPKLQSQKDGSADDLQFEVEYRRTIARKLDRLELFGVTVDEASRRINLSVAYVNLTATKPLSVEVAEVVESAQICHVDEALSGKARVLIRGLAGSGKSTLLQWLSIQAARENFKGKLSGWNGMIPFFIKLRRWHGTTLPTPERFLHQHEAQNLIADMPDGWVTRQLKKGSLVLIDGIDEVATGDRERTKNWIEGLANDFEKSVFIVTSRPSAVQEGWLSSENFEDSELLPMGISEIQGLVHQWHEAAKIEYRPETDEEIDEYSQALRYTIQTSHSLRKLATTPLLCAMICALHLDRKKSVPEDRMELYRIALDTLLDRRETERSIKVFPEFSKLKKRSKERLLRRVAYWLMQNSYPDAPKEEVSFQLSKAQQSLSDIHSETEEILDYFLERSGLLREPVPNRIDFVHRTFQEYLAAQEAVDEGDIGFLVDRADKPEWSETIALAAGFAGQTQSVKIVDGLLARSEDKGLRHRMIFLAVACLETSVTLDPYTREKVKQQLNFILPPRDITEAHEIANAGELAVSQLRGHRSENARVVSAVVRALGLIGGEAAWGVIKEEYLDDSRAQVITEVEQADGQFDEPLGLRVQAYGPNLNFGRPNLWRLPKVIDGHKVAKLIIRGVDNLFDIREVSTLSNLEKLQIFGCKSLKLIAPISCLEKILDLDISFCENVDDLTCVGNLKIVERITFRGGLGISDISAIKNCQNLKFLDLADCANIRDFSPLCDLPCLVEFRGKNTNWEANTEVVAHFKEIGTRINPL